MRKVSDESRLEGMMQRPIPKKKVGIVHLEMVKERRSLYGMERFTTAEIAASMVRSLVERSNREMFLVMSLDARLAPMALEIVAVGSISACHVEPGDIFRHAIINNARSLICFHNHPSGCPEPSSDDRSMTWKIRECGILLGIELIDHIIIGEGNSFYSFRENDALRKSEAA